MSSIIIILLAILQSDMFTLTDLTQLHEKLDAFWNGQSDDSKVRWITLGLLRLTCCSAIAT